MAVGDTIVRTCKHCGDEFTYTVRGAGRYPDYCGADQDIRSAQATDRYRQTDKYREAYRRNYQRRKEEYDPWMWENTIMDWNE